MPFKNILVKPISNKYYAILVESLVLNLKTQSDIRVKKKYINLRSFLKKNFFSIILDKRLYEFFFLNTFFLFFLRWIFDNKLNRYRNFQKYILAETLRSYKNNINILLYYSSLIKNIFKAALMYIYAQRLVKNHDFIYIHDSDYIEGIILDIFIAYGKTAFIKNFPENLSRVKNYKDQVAFLKRRQNNIFYKSKVEEYMRKRLISPQKHISYYRVTDNKKSINFSHNDDIDYAIYAHSFTDAQHPFGIDGFSSTYKWLIFTINSLIKQNKKICLKSHPNFYIQHQESSVLEWDKKIWDIIHELYKDKGLLFVNYPVSNFDFLQNLDSSKTIIISKHSNSIIEAEFLGFKTISSIASLWGGVYDISNTYNSRNSFLKLLKMNIGELNKNNLNELYSFINDKYLNPKGYHSNDNWINIITNFYSIKMKDFINKPSIIDNIENSMDNNIIQKISEIIN